MRITLITLVLVSATMATIEPVAPEPLTVTPPVLYSTVHEKTKLQDPTNVKQINNSIKDQARLDYEHEMNLFKNSVIKSIQSHSNATKTVQIGHFSITIQTSCELSVDPNDVPEPPTFMEKDCVKGISDAGATAKLIMKAVQKNPPSAEVVANAISTCKLEVSWFKQFKIYENCFKDGMPDQYAKLYDSFMNNLTDDLGWNTEHETWQTDENGNRYRTYTKKGEKATIDLEKSQGSRVGLDDPKVVQIQNVTPAIVKAPVVIQTTIGTPHSIPEEQPELPVLAPPTPTPEPAVVEVPSTQPIPVSDPVIIGADLPEPDITSIIGDLPTDE